MSADPATTPARRRLNKGDRVELSIESLAHGGAGVGRTDGFVVFARGGLPGDRVVAEVTGGKKRFAEARVVEVIEPGPDRVPERAPHPGAAWQSLRYDAQLAEKQRQVREALERLGGFDLSADDAPVLEPIVPAGENHDDPAIWNYRNKVEFSFGVRADEDGGGLALGYHRSGRWDVIEDVDDTVLASERANTIRRLVRDWCEKQDLGPYDRDERFGFLRNLVVREGRRTGDTMVRLVTSTSEPRPAGFDSAGFVTALNTLDPPPTSIVWSRSDDPGNATRDSNDKTLAGEPYIEEEILGLRYRISPDAFFQTNSDQTERLYRAAIEFAGLTGRELVYDLYCGSGTIGIAMAEHAKHVWGIEIVQDAVEDAAVNANLNGVTDADFIAGDMRLALPALVEHAGTPDVAVIDPPRPGLSSKVVRRVLEAAPKRIVYVSCNPTTLAPNLRQMVDSGYALRRVRPVDMFPHTPHIECVAVLDLVDDAKRVAVAEARREEQRAKRPSS
ncbi:MAG: 23S rRNA (uracil(1939)-C(5))-methyltransferase RlmD [Thermoleophilia bacterium]|nr:23S rRNA (uracil(1939)-C(5))-methyltransferase RlmD [Thermoleophilia bacterium]